MTNKMYNIHKPLLKDDKWLVFPNTIFSQLDTLDCNDTIENRCYEDKSFDQCLELCDESPDCSFGYFMKGEGKDICAPLSNIKLYNNPIYRLRYKSIYPKEMKYFKPQTFFDKDKINFPPEEGNNVFYYDNVYLQNIETQKMLFIDKQRKPSFIESGKNNLVLQLVHIPVNYSSDAQYELVKYGSFIAFNIPSTTLVFRKNLSSDKFEWVSISDLEITDQSGFKINPVKNIKEAVLYSDTFNLEIDNYFLGVDDNGQPTLYDNQINKDYNTTFRFIPNMEGFYCNEKAECTKVSLTDMDIDSNGIGRINGLAVGRNPGCWGVCKYKIPGNPKLLRHQDYDNHQMEKVISNITIAVIIIITSIIIIIIVNILKKHFFN